MQRNASKYLQRIMLELGENVPLVIFDESNLGKAVEQAIAGRISTAGQIFSGRKRFIVQNTIKEKFVELLIEKLSSLKYGNPLDEDVISSCCMINTEAADKVKSKLTLQLRQVLNASMEDNEIIIL